jgi:flagellar protein FliS
MNATSGEHYRSAALLTASPQQLRLMLIDAALAAVATIESHWRSADWEQASAAFVQVRRIVIELLCGVKPDASELARKVRSLYAFIFRTLTESQLFRDEQRLADARRLLQMERQTWQSVCEQQPAAVMSLPVSLDGIATAGTPDGVSFSAQV